MAIKWILFTNKHDMVEIKEADVLVGEKVATILPKGNGKRAIVVPRANVFCSRLEARKAAAAGGKLTWVALRGWHRREVLHARVRQHTQGQYGWRFTIHPVDSRGRRKNGEPIGASENDANFFKTEKEALTFLADNQISKEADAQEELVKAQTMVKCLKTLRARMRALKVKIPTEKQLKARRARKSRLFQANHNIR